MLDNIRLILLESQPLLLFVVIGSGYLLGQVRVGGFSLGLAGVLFAGLAMGSWQAPEQAHFEISHQITQLGLIFFVYAIGLTSGPGFFQSLRLRGLRYNLAVLIALIAGAAIALFAGRALHLGGPLIAGVFCGSITNTPALAALIESLKQVSPGSETIPAVGYSLAYPFGVIGALLGMQIYARLMQRQLNKEQAEAREQAQRRSQLVSANFEVRNPALYGQAIGGLRVQDATGLIISRHQHHGNVDVATKYSVLNEGDVVLAVGNADDIEKGRGWFGAPSTERLDRVDQQIELRRVLVSNKALVGRAIGSLELDHRFKAQVTRIRRADIEMLARPETQLEIGDRLRIVMPSDQTAEVQHFFGDREREMADLDFTALTLGISLGVLFGMIPLPLPGGVYLSLGFAGGPLVVSLILGRLGRTGPLTWQLPMEANHTLRHIGLLMFLAGVGVGAGGSFAGALGQEAYRIVLLGALLTTFCTLVTMSLLHLFGKTTVTGVMGGTSGMQTQPATLAKAYELTESDDIYVAYATTYPVATVAKIILAQLILLADHFLS